MRAFSLCRRLGWSYQELAATPAAVVHDFSVILAVEQEMQELADR